MPERRRPALSTPVHVVLRAGVSLFNNPFSPTDNLKAHFTAHLHGGSAAETQSLRRPLQGDDGVGCHLNKRVACRAAVETPRGTSLVTRSTERNCRLIRLPHRDMMQAAQPVNTHLFMTSHKYHGPPERTADDGGCLSRRKQRGVNPAWPALKYTQRPLYLGTTSSCVCILFWCL